MIIFDLDGTLANIDHRRHFVDVSLAVEKGIAYEDVYANIGGIQSNGYFLENDPDRRWKPDWKAFYESCDEDKPNQPVIEMWDNRISLGMMGHDQIWSGRCESVREKTVAWLHHHLCAFQPEQLKMRPIGDSTPDDQLKEKWLDDYIDSMWPKLSAIHKENDGYTFHRKDPIEFLFDSDPLSILMWRRRGIFVFNCCQHDEDF